MRNFGALACAHRGHAQQRAPPQQLAEPERHNGFPAGQPPPLPDQHRQQPGAQDSATGPQQPGRGCQPGWFGRCGRSGGCRAGVQLVILLGVVQPPLKIRNQAQAARVLQPQEADPFFFVVGVLQVGFRTPEAGDQADGDLMHRMNSMRGQDLSVVGQKPAEIRVPVRAVGIQQRRIDGEPESIQVFVQNLGRHGFERVAIELVQRLGVVHGVIRQTAAKADPVVSVQKLISGAKREGVCPTGRVHARPRAAFGVAHRDHGDSRVAVLQRLRRYLSRID